MHRTILALLRLLFVVVATAPFAAAEVYYATNVPPVVNWMNPQLARGEPPNNNCNNGDYATCNTGGSYLTATGMESVVIPAGMAVETVRVQAYCQWRSGDRGGGSTFRVRGRWTGTSSAANSPIGEVFTGNTTACGWYSVDITAGEAVWTQAELNSIEPRVRRGSGTPSGRQLRVKAFRLRIDFGADCNGNGIVDSQESFPDCNGTGVPDSCELSSNDCNGNGVPDECESDCDGDGVPNACEPDCDGDGVPDDCESDCDGDGVPNDCEPDCDGDGVPDDCDSEPDCNGNGIPDNCDVGGGAPDCNLNGVPDSCELSGNDCDGNGVPDDCESDCDGDGTLDVCDGEPDCDSNGVPDNCDLAGGAPDCQLDGVPDVCQITGNDCNANGIPDDCDVAGPSPDCDGDGTPDECELAGNDCNQNGLPDECDEDVNADGTPDVCQPIAFCYGTACPCGNDFGAAGCLNSRGLGGWLDGPGQFIEGSGPLTLIGRDCPPNNLVLVLVADALQPSITMADGRMCLSGQSALAYRYLPMQTDVTGTMELTDAREELPPRTFRSGTTFYFQAWYRDVFCTPQPVPCPSPCGAGSNFTNVAGVVVVP